MIRIAISGFGRIGRTFLRTVLQDPRAVQKLKIVAINIGPARLDTVAHMFKYDTVMGTYAGDVALEGNELVIDGYRIAIVAEIDPVKLPWKFYDIDWVVECSGKCTNRAGAQKHRDAGAKRVLISSPAKDEDVTIIQGVNDDAFDARTHTIVSLGSCTTNACVPMLKVMHDTFGIVHCAMTTTHAYTNSQVLLDVEGEDLRRSRAAALNIIPTSTGALKLVSTIIPALDGRVSAVAIRVPVAIVSLIDCTIVTERPVTVDAINNAFVQATHSTLSSILDVTKEPLVSSDFIGNSHSVVIDSLLTASAGTHMAKVFGWYDNEWGYSCRLKDFLIKL